MIHVHWKSKSLFIRSYPTGVIIESESLSSSKTQNLKRCTANSFTRQHPNMSLAQLAPKPHTGAISLQLIPSLETLPQLLLLSIVLASQNFRFFFSFLQAS